MTGNRFINPVLRGFYPDPSICRVGDDYYLAHSSFEFFPGIPIHHSRDLVNWELIGYALHREEQLEVIKLHDVQKQGGIYAPTLRYHEGTFYLITTNVYGPPDPNVPSPPVNFILTTQDIRGEWSMPHVIDGARGIDPHIHFEEDGTVWYAGTHNSENPEYLGKGEIYLQQLDPETWQFIGERYELWRGSCNGAWVEGPHIYKENGLYYLLTAEGGTGFNHAVMIAASENLTGPYRPNPQNPILTSRHLSHDYWVHSVGHADLVELPDGRWYMFALGVRGEEKRGSNMGRESFLVPVQWENEKADWVQLETLWPVCAPETGRVERLTPMPFPGTRQHYNDAFFDTFDSDQLHLEWNYRRKPLPDVLSLTDNPGHLRLYTHPTSLGNRKQCAWIGMRQKESDFTVLTKMLFTPTQEGEEAGLSLFQQDDSYLNFTVTQQGGQAALQLRIAVPETEPEILHQQVLEDYDGAIIVRVVSQQSRYHFSISLDEGKTYDIITETPADSILSTGFTGAYFALYTSSNGAATNAYADFDWFSYQGHVRL